MYSKSCEHCGEEFVVEDGRLFSNHVRWCDKNPRRNNYTKDKFLVPCSCLECRKELTTQGLQSHVKKHDRDKEIVYYCKECNKELDTKGNTFCSRSCSAKYNNRNKDYTKFKPGPPKQNKPKKKYPKSTPQLRESVCKVCRQLFTYYSRITRVCCSEECRIEIIKHNRGRGKRSYMESSFCDWLDERSVPYETEVHFRNEELNKSYFVDFLFRGINLVVELDGSQHEQTIEQDKLRDEYLKSLGLTVIRITHKEYQDKSKITYLETLLDLQ